MLTSVRWFGQHHRGEGYILWSSTNVVTSLIQTLADLVGLVKASIIGTLKVRFLSELLFFLCPCAPGDTTLIPGS